MPAKSASRATSPVYLLYGRKTRTEDFFDDYTAGEHIARITAGLGGADSIQVLDATVGECDVAQCIDDVATPVMWGTGRLMVLREAQKLLSPAVEQRERVEAHVRRLTALARGGKAHGAVALVASGLELKAGSPHTSFKAGQELIGALAESGALLPCIPPYEDRLAALLMQRAREAGVRMLRDAAELLVQIAGTNQLTLQAELDKLVAAAGAERTIGAELVEAVAGQSAQPDVFSLANSMMEGNAPAALATLANLRETPATRAWGSILGGLQWSFRQYLKAAVGRERGLSGEEAATAAGVKYHRESFARRLANWDSGAILALLDRALACDVEIKTGTVREELAIETFVIDACKRHFGTGELVGRWLYEI